uniref:Uncharacterized protein n=1 Tax=Cacopsylla melanoneura TaxID=428564 RepID=A0A8D8Z5D8_9HEMI
MDKYYEKIRNKPEANKIDENKRNGDGGNNNDSGQETRDIEKNNQENGDKESNDNGKETRDIEKNNQENVDSESNESNNNKVQIDTDLGSYRQTNNITRKRDENKRKNIYQ